MRILLGILIIVFLYCSPVIAADQIPVLLYHHINYDNSIYSITPERFDRDLGMIANSGYGVINLATFTQFLAGKQMLPDKALLITLDDGYADNYEYAYPILKKHGLTAVFFIVTGDVGKQGYMTAENLRVMFSDGMSFGSHTVSHPILTDVDDYQLKYEMVQSKTSLEMLLGFSHTPILAVAYPGGAADFRVRRASTEAGYRYGFSTNVGLVTDRAMWDLIPRIPIFRNTRSVLAAIDSATGSPFTR